MSEEYQIAETATFKKGLETHGYQRYYKKLTENVYPRLKENPYLREIVREPTGSAVRM